MNFEELGLPAPLIAGLAAQGITAPTPVQQRAIPLLLEGKDALIQSETGTGKTLAYLLPFLARADPDGRLLVLTPTRELAMQVHRQVELLAKNAGLPVKSVPVFADVSLANQVERLKSKPRIVVGTATRMLELIRKKKIPAHLAKTVVLDEVDKLLDDANRADVEAVLKCCLRDIQVVMASASVSREIQKRAAPLAKEPVILRTAPRFRIPETVEHIRVATGSRDKLDVLTDLLRVLRPRRAIVFINTPEEISRAADKLRRAGLQAQSLSGSQKKLERQRALTAFADGEAPLLIASDLAARGLHVEGVDMIFHVTLPESPLDYLHRAGRTGRGASGLSVVLAKFRERALTGQYERALDFQFIDKQLDGDRRRLLPVPAPAGKETSPRR